MMKHICHAIVLGCLCLDTAESQGSKLSLAGLQGRWQMTQLTRGGVTIPSKSVLEAQIVLEITKDKYAVSDGAGQPVERGTLVLNEAASPVTLDQQIEEGRDKGKVHRSIVKFVDGKLQWCQGDVDQPRPKEFASPQGRTDSYAEFERLKE